MRSIEVNKKNTENWMHWYHQMSPEEKKAHNQARYRTYKSRYNANSKQWAKDNPEKMQASGHTTQIRKTEAWTENSPTSKELYAWLVERKNTPCKYCGGPSRDIDHIVPVSKGGKHEFSNMQLICQICNDAKFDRPEEIFLQYLDNLLNYRSTLVSKKGIK